MPGICGIISKTDRQEIIDETIRQMAHPMLRTPTSQGDKISDNGYAIASVAIDDSRPVWSEQDITLAIAGDFTDRDALVNRLRAAGSPVTAKAPLSEILLKAYRCFGLDALCGLNGVYTIAIWENVSEQLTLVTDRIGIGKMYFWQNGRKFYFASEQKSICLLPEFSSRINQLAVMDFLIAENALDDRTYFEDIKIMDAAQVVVFRDGQLSKRRYWDFSFYQSGDTVLQPEAYINGLAYLVRQAVLRRVHSNATLLLTGGLDSRSVAGAWKDVAPDIPILTNTIGQPGCRDVWRAREISKNIGLNHTTIPANNSYLANYAAECVWRTEGNINVHASWIFAEDNYLTKNKIKYAMTGIYGDMIGGRFRPPELLSARTNEDLEKFLVTHPWINNSFAQQILRPEIFQRYQGQTYQTLWDLTQEANSKIPWFQFDYMVFRALVRREATSVDVLSDNTWVLDPFIDKDLIDYVFHQPPGYRNGPALYKKMITQYFPDVASVGYGNDDTSLRFQVAYQNNEPLKWLARTGRRIRNRLTPDTTSLLSGDRPYWNVPLNGSIRNGSRAFVEEVFAQSEYYDDVFDVKQVRQLLDDQMTGKINDYRAIGYILTFSLWRKMFCDRQYSPEGYSAIPAAELQMSRVHDPIKQ